MSTTLEGDSGSEPIPLVPFVVVLCFISLASVLGNCLVCLAMYQQPRLRTVMHYPMLSLGKSKKDTKKITTGTTSWFIIKSS